MANYTTVEFVKSELDISSDKNDDLLMGFIEAASGLIDTFCDRHFDKRTGETRYFDGAGNILFIDDLLTITASSFKLDEDGDGTYESVLATTDYVLYPLNTTPKRWIEISSNSDYGSFAAGIKKGVEIKGDWGYDTVPAAIRQACIIQSCRWHRRKESGYATTAVGSTETGEVIIEPALDPDVKLILKKYQRRGW